MNLRRVLRLLSAIIGFIAGVTAVITALVVRRMIAPPRQMLWTSPAEMGMVYENVSFPALDGVRLAGWFIPAPKGSARGGATIILLHGWLWNRLGDAAAGLASNLAGTTPVELLRLAHSLHHEGFSILMFDLRNHGESAGKPPVTFGQTEADDLLGAIDYLKTRSDVNADRLAAIGFAMGGNAILYALPRTNALRAAVAVQPTTFEHFAAGYAQDMFGPVGRALLPLVEGAYQTISGVSLGALQPAFAAAGAGDTPVLFVQSKYDPWGSIDDVARMQLATPNGEGPLLVDGTHHYEGFQYLIENPRIAVTYLEQYLA